MRDPKRIEPSTDAGSDAFGRFRYQAEVTVPFCLLCALGEGIDSVIPEHIEDIAIESGSSWRFIQVKSRNPERGLWKLKDVLADRGALHSLFRTHTQIREVDASLELLLEGAIKPGDPIEYLRSGADHRHPDLLIPAATALSIDQQEAIPFLERVVLQKTPAPRPHIRDNNLRLIHEQRPSLDHATVREIQSRLIAEIERAMRADRLGPDWPTYVTRPDRLQSELAQRLEAKRLTRAHLRQILVPVVSPPKYLLRRLTDRMSNAISILEQKLLAGGATPQIVERARSLRLNALLRYVEFRSRSLFPVDELFEDLHERLETYVTAECAKYASAETPAVNIWTSLLTVLSVNPALIDRNGLLNADPLLLLGQVCELADRCVVDFGIAHAD